MPGPTNPKAAAAAADGERRKGGVAESLRFAAYYRLQNEGEREKGGEKKEKGLGRK